MLMDRLRPILTPFFSRRLGVVLLLGFSSGLPLALTGSTLQAWMATENVDIRTIGLFTLAGIPYTWKFLWSPFMDRFVMPFLGRRRGWMLVTQLALMGSEAALGSLSATGSVGWLSWMAIGVAFLSASQDIVIDAYRTDLLLADERGLGSGLAVLGYRIGMLVSGALALLMASVWGWSTTYMVMAAFMGVGLMATLLGPEPTVHSAPPPTLKQAVLLPLKDFLSRTQAGPLLALIVLYKLGDAFAGALTTAFLIKGVGFSIVEVGTVNKGVGLLATLSGALVGGLVMTRWRLYYALLWFGLLQGLAALGYALLAAKGQNLSLMVLAVFLENFTSGMGTAAFTALLMALCNPRFTATQFALLSALSAVGRVYVGPLSGVLVVGLGWGGFFLFSVAASLPGVWLVWRLRLLLLAL